MKRVLCCLMLFALAGCAGVPVLSEKPEITLAGIDAFELGPVEQRFVMKLRIRNPNEFELPVNGLFFDVEINGQRFAKGMSDQFVIVPRMGEAVLEVKATGTIDSVLKQVHELQRNGRERVDYRVFGSANLENFGSLHFDRRGDLPMPLFDRSLRSPQLPLQRRS
jgi:LEA14-like dessication related protein